MASRHLLTAGAFLLSAFSGSGALVVNLSLMQRSNHPLGELQAVRDISVVDGREADQTPQAQPKRHQPAATTPSVAAPVSTLASPVASGPTAVAPEPRAAAAAGEQAPTSGVVAMVENPAADRAVSSSSSADVDGVTTSVARPSGNVAAITPAPTSRPQAGPTTMATIGQPQIPELTAVRPRATEDPKPTTSTIESPDDERETQSRQTESERLEQRATTPTEDNRSDADEDRRQPAAEIEDSRDRE